MIKFYNSGLYMESFYTKHKIDYTNLDVDEINYNHNLMSHYWPLEDCENYYNQQERIEFLFYEKISYSTTYFEPLVVDEDIAFQCDLVPFTYKDINLLALGGCGMDLSPKLDAYQFLTDKTIDKHSQFFNQRDYFTHVVGEEITNKISKTGIAL